MKSTILLFGFFLMAGCQDANESEYYGNLLSSPSGLILVQSEHPDGWEKTECTQCHNTSNFHQNRSNRESGIEMNEIRDYVTAHGTSSCSTCHGDNGIIK